MADKFTQLILDALTRAAAEPGGLLLVAGKSEPGLFPNTAAAKPAAQKAIDDGLLRQVRTEVKGKLPRELYAASEQGLQFLIDQSNPKQILEDFVRRLEEREEHVRDLLAVAKSMAESLSGMRAVTGMVLPRVVSTRVAASVTVPMTLTSPATSSCSGAQQMNGVAMPARVADPRVAAELEAEELAEAILARLSDWASSAAAGQDCPLPDLYRSLTCREQPPTIGQFHDSLRSLLNAGRVYLHPWTGPLYALPEPAYALLSGHNIAYYASLAARQRQ